MTKPRQLKLLKDQPKAYGGDLRKKQKGRGARPLVTNSTMHLVLRSTKAQGDWSFSTKENRLKIKQLVEKFSFKYGVRVLSLANVGNHLHFQIRLGNRFAYKTFIRALTGSIAMAVTGVSRWNSLVQPKRAKLNFWDGRPFTRVVQGYRHLLTLKNYIEINVLEGLGCNRSEARMIIGDFRRRPWKYENTG